MPEASMSFDLNISTPWIYPKKTIREKIKINVMKFQNTATYKQNFRNTLMSKKTNNCLKNLRYV